nr:hypothetical protein [Synechococcus sp. PCC 6312]
MVNLGLEWNSGNRSRDQAIEARNRADEAGERGNEAREREIRRDLLADEERQRAARQARIQNQFIILQIRHQLEPSPQTKEALKDFLVFLGEYQDP